MVLDKKGILAAAQCNSEEVPFGKGKVLCTELSFSEVNEVRESKLIRNEKDEVDGFKFVGLLVTRCIRDAKGNRIFEDTDIDSVMAFPRSKYLPLAIAAQRLNGMSDDQVKNSEADQTDS